MPGSPELCTPGRRTVPGNKRKDSARGHKSEIHQQNCNLPGRRANSVPSAAPPT